MDSHANPSPRLLPHSRIAVIGGGPAGSFFALHALQVAALLNLPLDITIFERKDLRAAGPRGCNMCAGILSRRVVEGLAALGIVLPPEVILGRVRSYLLHWKNTSIAIRPPDPGREVLSVYRAGGPRKSPYAPTDGLDEFLLEQARARGARVLQERVEQVCLQPSPSVRTASHSEPFDLIVLAAGVNASPPDFTGLQYAPPATEAMAQDALLLETTESRSQMDSTVHIYFDQPSDLIFGALVPKGPFAAISLLGQRLRRDSIEQLLAVRQVQEVVGQQPAQLCGCRPRVAISVARDFCADRFVAVGDSCVSRLYKDGIGSALATGQAAAETALLHGVSRAAFEARYAPVCHAIARDNRFGRVIFALIGHSKRNAFFMRGLGRALRSEEAGSSTPRVLSPTLWALFTGDANYAEILQMALRPRGLARIVRGMLQELKSR